MDFDIALAEFARDETRRRVRDAHDGEADFFVQALMYLKELD